jgi:hypothetical protein
MHKLRRSWAEIPSEDKSSLSASMTLAPSSSDAAAAMRDVVDLIVVFLPIEKEIIYHQRDTCYRGNVMRRATTSLLNKI